MKTVKSKSELKAIFMSLDSQGFGYYYRDAEQMIERKVNKIIQNANIHGLKIDGYDFTKKLDLGKLDKFADIEKAVKKYFSKFNANDKMNEVLNRIYCRDCKEFRPWKTDPENKQIEFNKAFKEFKLTWKQAIEKDENFYSIYDLSKSFVKINYSDKNAIEYIFENVFNIENFKLPYYIHEKYEYGKNYTLNGLTFTFYQNGNLKLSHKEISTFKKMLKDSEKYAGRYYKMKA